MAVGWAAEEARGVLQGAPSKGEVTGHLTLASLALLLLLPLHPFWSGRAGDLGLEVTSQRISCLSWVMLAGLCHWDEMDFVGYLGALSTMLLWTVWSALSTTDSFEVHLCLEDKMCAGWCVPTCSRACVGALCVLCVPAGMWTWCGRVLPFVGSLASAGVSFRYRQSPPEGTPHRFLRASYLKAEIHMAFALYPTAHQLVLQSTTKENSDLQQRAKQSIFQNSGLTFAPLEAGPPRKPWWGGLGPAASPGAASPGV